ncbi:ATP-binding protein [Mesorhizobium sp. M00.F.Ca.ET.217.01.1.1]|uniref:ATP-binding protein n=1 Tax=Mesorhizobium sp. M00.F.Ca.ET.217.01.1.1 TaxID=2500529 RepID=UPI000FD71CCB|nr:ATP-binding protein [Mesorhizobium sp. M00.F.Ca.ET.217.01.1.1]TGQ19285.1 ATP-binding protein [Mesorhizobium sp. M00.F.Ca.ET.217.01.1.1]
MALSLASLRTEKSAPLPIAILYGVPKVGKTTLALEFPNPVYINTPGESPPNDLDVTTPGTVETFDQLLDFIGELITEEHPYGTLVIDSLDGLEPMIWSHTCGQNNWSNIEDPGYGKGYLAADDVWREYLRAIEALAATGVWVVQIAHTEITRFDSPTSEPYARYGIKLHKRGSALVQEASSLIGFMNYRATIKEKDVGFNKKVGRAEGSGERQIQLEERPGFIAGNRYGAPPSITYKKGGGWEALAKYVVPTA